MLSLCVLEANAVVYIVGSGIYSGRYLGSSDPSSGAYNRTISGCIKIWFIEHVYQYDNLATKPSPRDDGLVARLSS